MLARGRCLRDATAHIAPLVAKVGREDGSVSLVPQVDYVRIRMTTFVTLYRSLHVGAPRTGAQPGAVNGALSAGKSAEADDS